MEKKDLFNEKLSAGRRTYYFDLRESARGSKYLVLCEDRRDKDNGRSRSQLVVFEEHLAAFGEALSRAVEAAAHLEQN